MKSGTVSNVSLDVSKLRLKYLHPDYEGLRETVQKAIEAKPQPSVAGTTTPGTTPTPGKTATPGKSVQPGKSTTPPPPIENLDDACAYHPDGDSPS